MLWRCRWWRQRLRQRQRLHRGLHHRNCPFCHRIPGCESWPERACRWLCLTLCTVCSSANHAHPLRPSLLPTMEIILGKQVQDEPQCFLSSPLPLFYFILFFFLYPGRLEQQSSRQHLSCKPSCWKSLLWERVAMHHSFPPSQRSCSAIPRLDIYWNQFTVQRCCWPNRLCLRD